MTWATCAAAFSEGEAQEPTGPMAVPGTKSRSTAKSPGLRPEFQRESILQGGADEPDISHLEADSSHGVEVKADLERTEFRQLQRVRVIAEVKNISGQHRWLPPSGMNRYLTARVRVFDERGKLAPMTQFYEHEGRELGVVGMTSGAGGHSFNPRASFRLDLIPNLIYDMTRPGDYWILVEIPLAYSLRGPDSEGMLYARAKPLKVRILPEPATAPGVFVPDPDRP